MWQDWIISQAIGTLLLILAGDTPTKLKWKKALLKVGKAIVAAFPEDFPKVGLKP